MPSLRSPAGVAVGQCVPPLVQPQFGHLQFRPVAIDAVLLQDRRDFAAKIDARRLIGGQECCAKSERSQ
jgi:hypothetical protein